MALTLNDALADPAAAAGDLLHSAELYGVIAALGHHGVVGSAVFEFTMRPIPALERAGYPIERVRIVVLPDCAANAYVLYGRDRLFKHRNPLPQRDLCLQYRRDDSALRWLQEDGFEALVTLVHRHLMFEEAWRRHGEWPCEDAPHGEVPGDPHPVRTQEMRQEQLRWARH